MSTNTRFGFYWIRVDFYPVNISGNNSLYKVKISLCGHQKTLIFIILHYYSVMYTKNHPFSCRDSLQWVLRAYDMYVMGLVAASRPPHPEPAAGGCIPLPGHRKPAEADNPTMPG